MAEAVKGRRRRFPRSSSTQMEDLRNRLLPILGENKITEFPYDDRVNYSDEFDAHVHSAAVHAGVAMVVTDNTKDFHDLYDDPDDRPYDLLTSDEWLMLAAESAPAEIDAVIKRQHAYRTGLGEPFNLVKQLNDAKCHSFAEHVASRLQEIL